MLYHEGGRGVQHSVKVYLVFWGSNFSTSQAGQEVHTTLLKLFEGLTGSPYQGLLTQYFDSTGRVSSSVTVTSYTDESVSAPTGVGALRVEEEASKVIAERGWKPELSAQFMVLTAPGSTYETGFLNKLCAYHGVTTAGTNVTPGIIYAFVPYQGDPPLDPGCVSTGNPSGNPVFKTSKSAAHEYAEAATDPEPGETTYTWRAGAQEIADLCQGEDDFELPGGGWAQNLYDDHLNVCGHEDLEPPHVYAITTGPSGIAGKEATLHGIVNPEGLETKYYFEFGTSQAYGSSTAEVSVGSGVANQSASRVLTGLQPATTYHYRLVASNATGTTRGLDKTLTTQSPPKNTALPVVSPATPYQAIAESTTTGTWTGSPTSYAYQWLRCNTGGGECENIAGATSSSYTPTETDAGHTLVAKVTAENSAGPTSASSAATSTVKPAGQVTEYALPTEDKPVGVSQGPDGNLWFTNWAGKIGALSISGSLLAEYALPTGSGPLQITSGPDGNLWFTNRLSSKIGRITTSGAITEYALPTGSEPYGIAKGPDGNLWFTETGTSKVAKITTAGAITEYALVKESFPRWITTGPDGRLWFTGSHKIAKMTTAGAVTEYPLPSGSAPYGITAGPDGNLWFVDAERNKVGKITTSGAITEYSLPAGEREEPFSIAAGADGNLWFGDWATSKIGRITTSGAITEYALPTGSRPEQIAPGPDNRLWFTEWGTRKIGAVVP